MEIFCNNWSKLDLHAYKNGVIFDEETSTKKGKEHWIIANLPRILMEQDIMEDGWMKVFLDSIAFLKSWKWIDWKMIQL